MLIRCKAIVPSASLALYIVVISPMYTYFHDVYFPEKLWNKFKHFNLIILTDNCKNKYAFFKITLPINDIKYIPKYCTLPFCHIYITLKIDEYTAKMIGLDFVFITWSKIIRFNKVCWNRYFHWKKYLCNEHLIYYCRPLCYSDITWVPWHLKSLATWLYVDQLAQAGNKGNIKALYYWPFVKGIHHSLVDSLHKGPVMHKVFPRHKNHHECVSTSLVRDQIN